MREFTWRVGVAAALVGGYLLLWQPLRVWGTVEVVYPMLASLQTERAAGFRLEATRRPPAVWARRAEGDKGTFSFPGGLYFLLPATLLAVLRPRQLLWLWYFLFLLACGVLSLATLASGIAWADGWLLLHRFVNEYLIRAGSVGVPLLLLATVPLPRGVEPVSQPASQR